jgi:hypothetical protein
MARLQKKSRRQSPQDQPIIRHSLRDGFNAYTWSPWCAGLFGHHGDNAQKRVALDTSVGVSGLHDFTSASGASSRALHVHRSPPPRIVTIGRNVPLR